MPILRISWACTVLAVVACHTASNPPKRHPAVPLSATWTGGIDGGEWVDCHKLAGDSPRFECTAYNDYTGAPYSVGTYLPNFDVNRIPVVPRAYDAQGLIAIDDSSQLRAHGVVTFPFDSGHGKRQVFEYGKAVGNEESH